jgi:hypothetical protein
MCGPPSSSATRRSRAVSNALARPLGTLDAHNSSFRPVGAMAIALSGRWRNDLRRLRPRRPRGRCVSRRPRRRRMTPLGDQTPPDGQGRTPWPRALERCHPRLAHPLPPGLPLPPRSRMSPVVNAKQCHRELGEFVDGVASGQDARPMAESSGRPYDRIEPLPRRSVVDEPHGLIHIDPATARVIAEAPLFAVWGEAACP